ncbi:hypothetical protein [Bacteroides heparinolyticus]|uniref:hypothetical protein n=1 Tax=Prevotella heparinolytica TaxID=28113 RepID=UPI00359F1AA2
MYKIFRYFAGNGKGDDYPAYFGMTLEMYFYQQMIACEKFKNIGSWWQSKKGKGACGVDFEFFMPIGKNLGCRSEAAAQKKIKPEGFAER